MPSKPLEPSWERRDRAGLDIDDQSRSPLPAAGPPPDDRVAPTGPSPPLHFARFEIKYLLDQGACERIEADLAPFLELDAQVARGPAREYPVRSLYFDDRRLSAAAAKQDGLRTRAKFRLRTYSHDPNTLAVTFLEQKGRHGALVYKHRTPIVGCWDRSLRGEALRRLLIARTAPGPLRDQFEVQAMRHGIRPLLLVDYLRRPYRSRFDPEFRVTFDRALSAGRAEALFPVPPAGHRQLLRGYTVMEVKFRQRVPSWFHRVLQAHELCLRPISKVCAGIEALGLRDQLT